MRSLWASVFATLVVVGTARGENAPGVSEAQLRPAATRALTLLVDASAAWPDKRTCTSCHHQLMPALTFALARSHGVTFDRARAAIALKRGYTALLELDRAVQATRQVDPAMDSASMLS